MSDRSPLFIHALELLIQSMELFRQAHERKYTFIVIHLAEAVELILQDRLIDAGQSIYESGKTMPLNGLKVMDLLKKEHVKLPERPLLEFLLEDRNTLYHRFGHPELKAVYRYLDDVTGFLKRFLRDEYQVELADILSELGQTGDDLQLFGVLEGQGNLMAFLNALFELSPESALAQAFNFVEAKFGELAFLQATYIDPRAKKSFLRSAQRNPEFLRLLDGLTQEHFLTRDLVNQLDLLRAARNYALYREDADAPPPDWEKAFLIAKGVLTGLDNALENKYAASSDAEEHAEID